MANDSPGGGAARKLKRLLFTVVFLGLAGAVAFLLSQLNARTYALEVRDGKLVVLKGRPLPFGTEPYRPADSALADTYAPIDLQGQGAADLLGRKFGDRDELDRVLFDVLEALAKPRVASDDPKALEQGMGYLRRAERLAGVTEAQRESLKSLRAEVAFFKARGKLEEAQRLLVEAMGELRLAAQAAGRHSRRANMMISEVEPAALALEQSLRKAVHTLSAPAAELPAAPAPPEPAPEAPPEPEPAPDATAPSSPQ